MKIKEKQSIAEDLKIRFEKTTAVFLTDFKGLNVASISILRRNLRKVNVEFQVVKNSILVRASEGNSVESIKDKFKGPSAVALCYDDPVISAKVLNDFASNNDMFEIKSGVLADRILTRDLVRNLAVLPSKDILLAQLLSSMLAVPTSLLTVLNATLVNLINVLKAVKIEKDK